MAIQRLTDKTALATTPADDDLLMIVDVSDTSGSPEGTSKKITVATLGVGSSGTGTVTSVALTAPSALTVAGSPITTSGTIVITGAGATTEYIDGTGTLQTFPAIPSGTVTDVTATAPIASSGGTTPDITISDATTSASGAMSGADKTKLDGIASGAEVNAVDSVNTQTGAVVLDTDDIAEGTNKYNVQSDWNATSGLAVILNKPTIPSVPVDDVTGGVGLTASPTTGNVVVNLDDTAVTAGVYTNADITVDAQGRLTSAASGSSGTGTVTSVAMTAPPAFSVGGSPITTSGTLALTASGSATEYIDGTGALQTLPQATVTSVTGTAPIAVSGGTSKVVSISAASPTAAGSLSATDKLYLNNIIAPFDDTGLNDPKNTIFEVANGLSQGAGTIVSILQDTVATNTNANSKDFLGVETSVNDRAVINGVVEVPTITGATVGKPLYLGTSGTFTPTAPTTPSGVYVRVLGHFLGTTSGGSLVYFNPSNDWIERT